MFGKKGILSVDVRDKLFENVFSEYLFEFTKAEIRKRVKEKTPTEHEKLKELRKKLDQARKNWNRAEYEKISKQIEELKKKINEKTPKEQNAMKFISNQIKGLRKARREYFSSLISEEIIKECVEVAISSPEKLPAKVGEILYGEAVAEDGKGAMGSE